MGLRTRMYVALTLLFGLLFAVMMGVTYYFYYTGAIQGIFIIIIPLILALLLITLQWAVAPSIIKWIFKIRWVNGYSPRINGYISNVCMSYNISRPRLGIIDDDNPNAFCFGWTRDNSFLVITRGIKKYCDEEEQKAVVGHELGHIANNDFVVMTIVAAVPLVCYVIFRGAITVARVGSGGGKEAGKAAMFAFIVAVASYIVYIFSQFIALLISRYREYMADRISAKTTRQPDKLASALVKIAYGLAVEGKGEESDKKHKRYENTLMIFNAKEARAMAANYGGRSGKVDKERIKKAMAWDLWNPWAFFLELESTHPLPAKRIKALDDYAKDQGLRTYIDFDLRQPETYWDDFIVDIVVSNLWLLAFPITILMAVKFNPVVGFGGFLFFSGLFLLLWCGTLRYPFKFKDATVGTLLGDVKVSPVRGRPVKLKGTIIGRGVPGLFYSEDMKLDDGTGLMLLDYHQISRFIDFMVGVYGTKWKIGKRAEVWGWYRRRIVPYVEIYKMKVGGMWKRIFTQILLFAGLILMILIGAIMILVDMVLV